MSIVCKSTSEIVKKRRSGHIVRQVLEAAKEVVAPGVSPMDLERVAERKIRDLGAKPAFKGYYDYPCVLCTSVNDEIVHGIPSERRGVEGGGILFHSIAVWCWTATTAMRPLLSQWAMKFRQNSKSSSK